MKSASLSKIKLNAKQLDQIPIVKNPLSINTTGIKAIQIAGVKVNVYKKITEPTACAVNVAPKLFKINLFLKKLATKGINQIAEYNHASLPTGFSKNKAIQIGNIIAVYFLFNPK